MSLFFNKVVVIKAQVYYETAFLRKIRMEIKRDKKCEVFNFIL